MPSIPSSHEPRELVRSAYEQVRQSHHDLRGAVAEHLDKSVGGQTMIAKARLPNKKFRHITKAAGELHKKDPGKPFPSMNRLEEAARTDKYLAFFLRAGTAKKLPRSIITENIAKFDDAIKRYEQLQQTELGSAEIAFKRLMEALPEIGNNDYKTHLEKLGTIDSSRGKLDEMLVNLSEFEKKNIKLGINRDGVLDLARTLRTHLENENFAATQLEQAHIFREAYKMLRETMRNGSYRALSRYINEGARGKLMMWLNVIGMITMVLTIPLMITGLQQFVQSMHHNGNQGQ